MEKMFILNGQEVKVQDYKATPESVSFSYKGKNYYYMLVTRNDHEMILDHGGRFRAAVSSSNKDGEFMIMANGREATGALSSRKLKKSGDQGKGLNSPMPGKIFKILKEAGTSVKKGEPIMILEAMKMEHSIKSDKDGVVKKINYQVGELVQGGVTLLEVE